MGFQVLTHPALLKPALQASSDSLGCRDQVLTHLALLKSALQAGGGRWGLVSVVQLTCGCDSGLRGRFPIAQFTHTSEIGRAHV